jgi:hypothetical protein
VTFVASIYGRLRRRRESIHNGEPTSRNSLVAMKQTKLLRSQPSGLLSVFALDNALNRIISAIRKVVFSLGQPISRSPLRFSNYMKPVPCGTGDISGQGSVDGKSSDQVLVTNAPMKCPRNFAKVDLPAETGLKRASYSLCIWGELFGATVATRCCPKVYRLSHSRSMECFG